jgi:hypothetical protein
MKDNSQWYVVVCKDEVVVIEAGDFGEAFDVFECEFPQIDVNTDKFTVLPVTRIFYDSEKLDEDEEIIKELNLEE